MVVLKSDVDDPVITVEPDGSRVNLECKTCDHTVGGSFVMIPAVCSR